MNDGWEWRHLSAGFNPLIDNATDANTDNDIIADPDGDGLTNGQECDWNTNPSGQDTDNDGIADGYDTDCDGVSDGAEVAQNSDPNDASDGGLPNSRIPVPFTFGDPSGSASEKYRLEVTPVSGMGDVPSSFVWLNENYGACETKTSMLKSGWKYEVRLRWSACKYPSDGCYYPNYDYTLNLGQNLPANVVLDDPDSLFRTNYYGTQYYGASHFPVIDSVASIAVYAVAGVAICKPEDFSWTELEESRVVLDNEPLRIKIEIAPRLQSIAQCAQIFGESLTIKTAGTCPAGAVLPLVGNATISHLSGKSEVRISQTRQQLKALGLVPANDEDGVNEMAVYDVGTLTGNDGSDLSDSDAFGRLGYQWRGRATNERSLNLFSTPSNAMLSKSFMQAAGSEVVEVVYSGITSPCKQIMNQADYFYYSGHGSHKFGSLDAYEPIDMADRWTNDLDCVIIAGCSILDINDYNDNFILDPEDHIASPGKLWEAVGPGILLGYNYYAPADEGGAPARIINSWLTLRSLLGDVGAWM